MFCVSTYYEFDRRVVSRKVETETAVSELAYVTLLVKLKSQQKFLRSSLFPSLR
jgi:hypothetical protein